MYTSGATAPEGGGVEKITLGEGVFCLHYVLDLDGILVPCDSRHTVSDLGLYRKKSWSSHSVDRSEDQLEGVKQPAEPAFLGYYGQLFGEG